MIAQSFAVRHANQLKALMLADTTISVRLTLIDKFQRYILASKLLMLAANRWMSVLRYINFFFKLAQITWTSEWFSRDPQNP
jgi:hypothetical protein